MCNPLPLQASGSPSFLPGPPHTQHKGRTLTQTEQKRASCRSQLPVRTQLRTPGAGHAAASALTGAGPARALSRDPRIRETTPDGTARPAASKRLLCHRRLDPATLETRGQSRSAAPGRVPEGPRRAPARSPRLGGSSGCDVLCKQPYFMLLKSSRGGPAWLSGGAIDL